MENCLYDQTSFVHGFIIKRKNSSGTCIFKGLGKAVAIELAREGAKVVIVGRDKTTLEQTTNEILQQGSFLPLALEADLLNPKDIQNLVEKTVSHFGSIDILLNNTGGPKDTVLKVKGKK